MALKYDPVTELGLRLFGHLARSGHLKDCGDITPIVNSFMKQVTDEGFIISFPQPVKHGSQYDEMPNGAFVNAHNEPWVKIDHQAFRLSADVDEGQDAKEYAEWMARQFNIALERFAQNAKKPPDGECVHAEGCLCI